MSTDLREWHRLETQSIEKSLTSFSYLFLSSFRQTDIAPKSSHAGDIGSSSNLSSASGIDQILRAEPVTVMAP